MKTLLALAAAFCIGLGHGAWAQKVNNFPNPCARERQLDVVEAISGNTDEINFTDFTRIDGLSINNGYERIMAVSDDGLEVWLDVYDKTAGITQPRFFRRADLSSDFTEVSFENLPTSNGIFSQAMFELFARSRMQAAWYHENNRLYMVGDSKLFLFERTSGKTFTDVTVMDFPSSLDENMGGLTFNPAGDHFYLFQQRDRSCKVYFHYTLDGTAIANADPFDPGANVLPNPGSITRAGNHFLVVLQDAAGGNLALYTDEKGDYTYTIPASTRSMPTARVVTGPAFYDGDRKLMVTMNDPEEGDPGELSVFWMDTRDLSREEEIYPTASQIRFYPNPADDRVCILQENESRIIMVKIYSATGALMGSYPWKGEEAQNCIRVAGYPQGVYILKALKQDGKTGVGRMVK